MVLYTPLYTYLLTYVTLLLLPFVLEHFPLSPFVTYHLPTKKVYATLVTTMSYDP